MSEPSEAMRKQWLWSLALHIRERMSKQASGLMRYGKMSR
jgi:hypothetical protein